MTAFFTLENGAGALVEYDATGEVSRSRQIRARRIDVTGRFGSCASRSAVYDEDVIYDELMLE